MNNKMIEGLLIGVAGAVVVAVLLNVGGCASVRAAGGEDWKDLSVLDQGTERHAVIAELGTPVLTEQDETRSTVDVFAFNQGDIALERASRSLFYGVAAVGTLGLSEILANPAEGMIGEGKEIQVRVTYDAEDRVDYTEVLKDDRWSKFQKIGEQQEPDEEHE